MPSRTYNSELEAIKAKDKKQKQLKNIKNDTTRYQKKTSNYRADKGHGIAFLDERSTVESPIIDPRAEQARIAQHENEIAEYDKALAKARTDKTNARNDMKEAKRRMVASRVADNKGFGVFLFDERGNKYYVEGARLTPAEVKKRIAEAPPRTRGAQTLDSRKRADVIYPSNPTSQMMDDYLANRGRTDMVGVDAPKGSRPNVKVGTNSGAVKKKASQKRKQTVTKRTPARVEREMIGPATSSKWVVTDQGRTYVGDKWGNYDNAGMMTSVRSIPAYEGPFKTKTCNGHTIRKAFYDPMTGTFNVLATKPGVKGTIIGRDYDPRRGLWQGGTYGRSDAYINDFTDGMRLVYQGASGRR